MTWLVKSSWWKSSTLYMWLLFTDWASTCRVTCCQSILEVFILTQLACVGAAFYWRTWIVDVLFFLCRCVAETKGAVTAYLLVPFLPPAEPPGSSGCSCSVRPEPAWGESHFSLSQQPHPSLWAGHTKLLFQTSFFFLWHHQPLSFASYFTCRLKCIKEMPQPHISEILSDLSPVSPA